MLTVTEFTRKVKRLLEGDTELQDVALQGEVSNLTRHRSGHHYFTLKDENSQVSALFFRDDFAAAGKPQFEEGQTVEVRGSINVYPARGSYSLLVRKLKVAGLGDLYRAFLGIKERLEAEGLFAPERKRALPAFPHSVALITSPTGAVIRDMVTTFRRRFPHVALKLIPAAVQGERAVSSLISALERVRYLPDVQVVILARGGGSLEDLWPFNDEQLARAIAACPVPVVSAVGHQTDFTIADFVADLRAPTPTAAAELTTPEAAALLYWLAEQQQELNRQYKRNRQEAERILDDHLTTLQQLAERMTERRSRELEQQQQALQSAWNQLHRKQQSELDLLERTLQLTDPRQVLANGYTLTYQGAKRIRKRSEVNPTETLEIVFVDGSQRSQPL